MGRGKKGRKRKWGGCTYSPIGLGERIFFIIDGLMGGKKSEQKRKKMVWTSGKSIRIKPKKKRISCSTP